MDISIDRWIKDYTVKMQELFGERIWFIGLQGSFARGEASENSDIDVVAILDHVNLEDIQAYSTLLDQLPFRDRACGFFSGKEELFCWAPSDLFQFYFDTIPVIGSLEELKERFTKKDVIRAVHIGACNIYHACVHNLVHEKDVGILKGLYKSAGFLLQAIAYLETDIYEKKKDKLALLLPLHDREILSDSQKMKDNPSYAQKEFLKLSKGLIARSSDWISSYKEGESI